MPTPNHFPAPAFYSPERVAEVHVERASLVAAVAAQVGEEAPVVQALRGFMSEQTEETWNAARTLFNRLPGKQRKIIGDAAVGLAVQLKQSEGGVLRLLQSLDKKPRPVTRKSGVLDWIDENGNAKPASKGRPSERAWR
jgi:hypothetical protein